MVTKCKDFDLENKWTFLLKGRDAGVPVTPFMDAPELVCKHINIEGGEHVYICYRKLIYTAASKPIDIPIYLHV
jgi:hypothetical protein